MKSGLRRTGVVDSLLNPLIREHNMYVWACMGMQHYIGAGEWKSQPAVAMSKLPLNPSGNEVAKSMAWGHNPNRPVFYGKDDEKSWDLHHLGMDQKLQNTWFWYD